MEAPRRAGWEWGGGGVLKKRSVSLSRVDGGGIGDKQVKGWGGMEAGVGGCMLTQTGMEN